MFVLIVYFFCSYTSGAALAMAVSQSTLTAALWIAMTFGTDVDVLLRNFVVLYFLSSTTVRLKLK